MFFFCVFFQIKNTAMILFIRFVLKKSIKNVRKIKVSTDTSTEFELEDTVADIQMSS